MPKPNPQFRAVVIKAPDEHYARLIVQSLQERFPHLGFLWEVVDLDPTVFCVDAAFAIPGVKTRVDAFAQGVLQGISRQIAFVEDGNGEAWYWYYCLGCGMVRRVEGGPEELPGPDEHCDHSFEQMSSEDLKRYQAGSGYQGE